MSVGSGKRELGRGERVLPGLWRLRLPLPWPGVPHVNAWAIASGDGIVLVDCGMHLAGKPGQPDSLGQLELAMAQVGLRLEQVKQLVITHAHTDHWGQAATVIGRSGAQMWMHPNHAHASSPEAEQTSMLTRWHEIALQGGVPEAMFEAYVTHAQNSPSGVALLVSPDRDLVSGVEIESDLGAWRVYETPGHAPSHVCLYQPERRVLISGDHLLGRISLFYDYGWSPDPIGDFLTSLDTVDALDARLCVAGHGRPFTDVHTHVVGTRARAQARLETVLELLRERPHAAAGLAPRLFEHPLNEVTTPWYLSEIMCMLGHLESEGTVVKEQKGKVELWRAV